MSSKKTQSPSKANMRLYEKEQAKVSDEFRQLGMSLATGKISRTKFKKQMQDGLKKYYIRIALLGKGGRKLTKQDRADLSRFLSKAYQYLDGFLGDLKSYKANLSEAQVSSRAASYAGGWGVYTRFTIPSVIADMLPALPGVDCLGGALCGCWLEWSMSGQTIEVYWLLNLSKEHCVLCVSYAADWQPLELELPDREEFNEEDWEDMLDW